MRGRCVKNMKKHENEMKTTGDLPACAGELFGWVWGSKIYEKSCFL